MESPCPGLAEECDRTQSVFGSDCLRVVTSPARTVTLEISDPSGRSFKGALAQRLSVRGAEINAAWIKGDQGKGDWLRRAALCRLAEREGCSLSIG